MTILITNINNYPQYLKEVTNWYISFWGENYPSRTESDWQAYIGRNTDKPPITLIAIDTNKTPPQAVGTISLRLNAMGKLTADTIWISALYVLPEYRGKKIGTQLINKITKCCPPEYNGLYLFTRTNGDIYKKLGWHILETKEYQGSRIMIMKKNLKVSMHYNFSFKEHPPQIDGPTERKSQFRSPSKL